MSGPMAQPERNEPERLVHRLHTHPKVLFVPVMWAFAMVVAAVAVAALAPTGPSVTWVQPVGLAACLVGLLVGTVIPMLRWQLSTFSVTTRHVQTREGILNRTGSDILLARITNVEIDKGILDRIFGCGTLTIRHAASPEGMQLRDVPRAEDVRTSINEMAYRAAMTANAAPHQGYEPHQ